jgi:hypothetical protein
MDPLLLIHIQRKNTAPEQSSYHAKAMQATKVLSLNQAAPIKIITHTSANEIKEIKEQINGLRSALSKPLEIEDARLVGLIREQVAEQKLLEMGITVDSNKDEVIMDLQAQVKTLTERLAQIPSMMDQIGQLEKSIPTLSFKVDNLELVSAGIQHDLTTTTTAVSNMEMKLAGLSTSVQVMTMQESFHSSFARLEKMVMSIATSKKENLVVDETNWEENGQSNKENNEEGNYNGDNLGGKQKDQIRQDDMTDLEDDTIFKNTKYPRWQIAVDTIANALLGKDDQNNCHSITPLHQNPLLGE